MNRLPKSEGDPPAGLGRMTGRLRSSLRCPACRSGLREHPSGLACASEACATVYPTVDGVPVLIDENTSVFSKDEFVTRKATFFPRHSRLRTTISGLLPQLSISISSRRNYRTFLRSITSTSNRPSVLVLGGAVLGEGLKPIIDDERAEFVETDVSLGPRTKLVCDGTSLPFADDSFEGVIVQAVLEHVVDPYKCVAEIHRVLRRGGFVYAETPFMQQVHGGPYDFTRFTHSGHRRLFREFENLSSGACCGPAMALAWSLQHFVLSFFASRTARLAVKGASRLLLFWLKYFDLYLAGKPQALDAASGLYFLGRKGDTILGDRELIGLFRGGAS